MYEATIPSFVARVAFFAAVAMPFVRRIVSAFSRSPLLSTRARFQSINPALVFARSCLTSFGSISVVAFIGLRIVVAAPSLNRWIGRVRLIRLPFPPVRGHEPRCWQKQLRRLVFVKSRGSHGWRHHSRRSDSRSVQDRH